MQCSFEQPRALRMAVRLQDALCALLLYAALRGAVCSMASLSALGLVPLVPGGCLALLLVAPRTKKWTVVFSGCAAALAVGLILLNAAAVQDGAKLLLNRLFAASEAQQAYQYEYFAVSAADPLACIRTSLLPLGLAAGLVCALSCRGWLRFLAAVLPAALCLFMAYLGVTPGASWLILLTAAALVLLFDHSSADAVSFVGRAAALLIALCIGAGAFFAFPDENPALSAWDERARDALALHTLAEADGTFEPEPETGSSAPEQEREFYEEETTSADLGDDALHWSRPLAAALVIALLALLLFVPAIWSDFLKKRRAKSRAGFDDPQSRAAICAMFLYALRWLRLGGLETPNRPYSTYASAVGQIYSPELQARYEAVLPLWHEAAYSSHDMSDAQRQQMHSFADDVRQTVWTGLSRRKRLCMRLFSSL